MEYINLNDKVVEYLEERILGLKEKGENFSLGIVDIDFYDFVKEEIGEEALVISMNEVKKSLGSLTRPIDLVEQINEHQYLVGVREFNQDSLKVLLDRLRMSVDQFSTIIHGKNFKFTISCGGTQLMEEDVLYSLISRGLDQLKKSQDFGSNRVSIG